jgi:hypothetical protein
LFSSSFSGHTSESVWQWDLAYISSMGRGPTTF